MTLSKGIGPAALIAAALTLPLTGSGAPPGSRGDLVASAHASAAATSPTEERSAVVRLRAEGRARATATASSTCDGCQSLAATVEVVYGRRGASVDNVAAAWSSCTGCGARSLAVQVVVLTGRGRGDVAATNRALAVNAACESCTSDAVAVQYVVLGSNGRSLSKRVRAEVEAFADRLARDAAEAPAPDRRSVGPERSDGTGDPALDGLTEIGDAIEGDLGGRVTVHVDRQRG